MNPSTLHFKKFIHIIILGLLLAHSKPKSPSLVRRVDGVTQRKLTPQHPQPLQDKSKKTTSHAHM